MILGPCTIDSIENHCASFQVDRVFVAGRPTEWWVRLAAIPNAPLDFLPSLLQDPEIEVREAAQDRLAEEKSARPQGTPS